MKAGSGYHEAAFRYSFLQPDSHARMMPAPLVPLAGLLTALAVLAGCTAPPDEPMNEPDSTTARPAADSTAADSMAADTTEARPLASANTAFALDLYERLADQQDGNLFFSPHSLSTALAMTYAGARGETARQMADVLRFPAEGDSLHAAFEHLTRSLRLPDTSAVTLRIANALWLQQGFPVRPAFRQRVRESYDGAARQVDFRQALTQARRQINRWVAERTEGKIERLFSGGALSPDTRLVLTNAVYFFGPWQAAFDSTRTETDAFTPADGGEVQVPLMQKAGHFPYLERPGFQALDLPYEGERLAMTIFLPRAPDGLDAFTDRLTPDSLRAWIGELGASRQGVRVFLPRFEMRERLSLGETLKAMGLTLPFTAQANLDGMIAEEATDRIDLNLDAVVHEAYVDVNEEGTEAAAATGVSVSVTSVGESPEPVVFRADHPFFFVIRDRATGALLFMGRLMDPAA